MKQHLEKLKLYFKERSSKELAIGVAIIGSALGIIIITAVLIFNSVPKVVYQPANACDLFSAQDARDLLGEQTVKSNIGAPVQSNNVSLSRCGYTNGSGDEATLIVAAIIVRSGINDKGTQQNKSEFTAGKPSRGVEVVTGLGDGAYFNQQNGQLNVLNGRDWIILSYGIGSDPQANTIEDAVALARKVVEDKSD